ncbi:MAG: GNAT family N-acetyltransferase [Solirubrobacterales bacterium]|nr:GNAT family N-acetyltransferase [Solirubrobacterales bacterium]
MHAAKGRVVEADWGRAFLDPDIPSVHDANFLWADPDADGAEVARHADRLLGGAGMEHRRILVAEPTGLDVPGYARAVHVFLALEGEPPEPRVAVEVAGIEDVLPAQERYLRTDPGNTWARDEAVRAQMLAHHAAEGRSVDEQLHVVRDRGEVVAWAKLWRKDAVAQIEDVVCLASHRGRGYGRAVVCSAARAARDAELVFIVAEEDDWPVGLYRRLGFAEIGRMRVLTRQAPTGR